MSSNVDRMNASKTGLENSCHCCGTGCFSWTAIIIGAIVGLGLGFLLNLLLAAIGLSAFTASKEGMLTLAASGFIGMVIGIMIVTFISGWISGFIGSTKCQSRLLGILYGFSSWCIALFLTMSLASSVGQFVSEEYQMFTNPHAAILKITSNASPGSGTTKELKLGVVSSPNTGGGVAKVTATDEKSINFLGKTLLMLFIVFCVAAITSSYGGFVGMRSGIRCHPRKPM